MHNVVVQPTHLRIDVSGKIVLLRDLDNKPSSVVLLLFNAI